MINTSFLLNAQYNSNFSLEGSWEDGSGRTIAANGNYIFVGSGNVLKIYDNSDLENPQIITRYNSKGFIYDILYSENLLYIASNKSGLEILDISIINSPILLSYLEINSYSPKLAKIDNYLFLGINEHIYTIDVENPANPQVKNDFEMYKGLSHLKIHKNWLYGPRSYYGYIILDISAPESPEVYLDVQNSDTYNFDAAIMDQTLYITESDSLKVYDISDPENITKTYTDYFEYGVFVELVNNDTLVLYSSYSDAKLYDISEPMNPEPISEYNLININSINECYLDNHTVYAISQYANMSVFNFGNNEAYQYKITNVGPGFTYNSHVSDSNVFLNHGGKGYSLLSYEDIKNPLFLGNYIANGISKSASFVDNLMYSCHDGLHIYDLSVPDNPIEIGFLEIQGTFYYSLVVNDYMYIADYTNGLHIIDISDPTKPIELSVFKPDGETIGIDVKNNMAILACRSAGISILDITDPLVPFEIGTLTDIGKSKDVKIRGEVAYVISNNNNCTIVDISDPSNPVKIDKSMGYNVHNILLHENYAFVSAGSSGLFLYDISNERQPVKLEIYKTQGVASHCSYFDGKVFLSDFFSGLKILSFDPTSSTNKLSTIRNKGLISPNPFDNYFNLHLDIDNPISGHINIYSNEGKLVFELKNISFYGGNNLKRIYLHGLNPGIYFLHIGSEVFNHVEKIIKY